MSSDKKQILAKIVRDIESYAGYLKENGVDKIVSFAQRQEDKVDGVPIVVKAGPDCGSTGLAEVQSGRGGTRLPRHADMAWSRPAMEKSRSDVETELRAIAAAVAGCKKCALHKGRNKTVPGQGNPAAPDILFIGEGPGEDEDRQGLAFVGRAGQLLTRLIVRMGFTRDEVFIANIVKCRPPNNRKPLPEEMNACRPYLEEQIAVLRPKTIVLLGASALEGLIPSELPGRTISRMRGKWLEYNGIPAMPTFHPSYLFRNQSAMWDVWSDMQLVLERLGRPVPEKA